MNRLVILFSRFSPYHLARLESAGLRLRTRGLEVVGVEVADHDHENPWDTGRGDHAFRRRTLFPGADYPALAPGSIAAAVDAMLNEEAPVAAALPGWSFPEALAGLRWCRARARPALLMSESARRDSPRTPWREAVKRCIVRQFAAGLVGGRHHVQYATQLGLAADRLFLGYDVVDNDHFARGADAARADALAQRARLRLPPRFFLASCRFIPRKNVARLLDAYARYRAEAGADAWGLVLCGDGPLRAALTAQAAALGVSEAVSFPGFVGYHELPTYYGLADAFVHVSEAEQWGLVVNEAMATGLPVLVSSACGCAQELVTDAHNGYTVSATDTAAMAVALRKLAGGQADLGAMGQASRARIASYAAASFGLGLEQALLRAGTCPLPRHTALGAFVLNRFVA